MLERQNNISEKLNFWTAKSQNTHPRTDIIFIMVTWLHNGKKIDVASVSSERWALHSVEIILTELQLEWELLKIMSCRNVRAMQDSIKGDDILTLLLHTIRDEQATECLIFQPPDILIIWRNTRNLFSLISDMSTNSCWIENFVTTDKNRCLMHKTKSGIYTAREIRDCSKIRYWPRTKHSIWPCMRNTLNQWLILRILLFQKVALIT